MSYSGYLAPYAGKIVAMAKRGVYPKDIATALIGSGVRPPYVQGGGDNHSAMLAMVRYVIRGGPPPKKAKAKWQTWTPEMQEAEFQREYGA